MSWLTAIWTFASSACLTLALVQFVIWLKRREDTVHLLLALTALGATGAGLAELMLLHTTNSESYALLVKWQHVPVFVLLVSMVWFVRVYFGTGRRWLAQLITALWLLALVFNFLSPHNLVFAELPRLQRVETWGTESFTIASGTRNPWVWVADFASFLIVLFVIDASVGLWRRGNRQRALLIGGSITFFILAAGIHSPLVDIGVVKTPYMISFAFLAVVAAMNYELGSDVVRAAVLSREVTQSERRWRSLLEKVGLVVLGIDRDGRVNYLNPFYKRLTGFNSDQMLGQPLQDLLVASERPAMTERLTVAGQDRPRPHSQWTLRCASGDERRVSFSTVKLFDVEGEFAGYLSVGADISERIRAERELQQTQRNLDRLSRANLLGELVSALAHELNQPLTAILSNAQAGFRLVTSGNPDLNEIRAILDDIARDDKRAGAVIQSLRGMLRGEAAPPEQIDLHELARGVIDLAQHELDNRQVDVRLKTDGAPLLVHGVAAELQQVVMNLLMNAVQAMRDTPASARTVVLETELRDDSAALKVRDHGCGVPDENLPTIFEPFTTTKPTGLGMGLAICRRLVDRHGGRISARNNEEGGGATFELTLPVHKAGE